MAAWGELVGGAMAVVMGRAAIIVVTVGVSRAENGRGGGRVLSGFLLLQAVVLACIMLTLSQGCRLMVRIMGMVMRTGCWGRVEQQGSVRQRCEAMGGMGLRKQ